MKTRNENENWLTCTFEMTTDMKHQIYCTFTTLSKMTEPWKLPIDVSHHNSELEKLIKLFPVSFICILWRSDSHLTQLQTPTDQICCTCTLLTLSNITELWKLAIDVSHYNSESEKTQKTVPSFTEMYFMEDNYCIFLALSKVSKPWKLMVNISQYN